MNSESERRRTVYVLLPAYNEEVALKALLPDLYHATDMIGARVHVIVVNDGSSDGTANADDWAPPHQRVEVISHERNRGLAAALTTGIERVLTLSQGPDDLMVCLDADNTHPPETIPRMVARAWDGHDVVIASRYRPGSVQRGVPAFRRFLSRGARVLFRLLLPIPGVRDFTCGFRAYRVSALREIWRRTGGKVITSQGFACTDELLLKIAMITGKITEVPFTLRYDQKPGESKLQLWLTIRSQLRVIGRLRQMRREGLPQEVQRDRG